MKIRSTYSWIFYAFGILICCSCSSNQHQPPELTEGESKNPYFDGFVDLYLEQNEGSSRKEAEEYLRTALSNNFKSASHYLSGTPQKIKIEEEVDLVNYRVVAEIHGASEEAEKILTALCDSTRSISKTPRGYFLTISFTEQEEPTYVFIQGGLFQIKDKGTYWSDINLEAFIKSLIKNNT